MWFQNYTREVRDSFQPYLMASGQSKGAPGKALGGEGAKGGWRRRKEKAAPLDIKLGGYGESPEFLTKGQFQRGAEGLQSMLQPRAVVEIEERMMGVGGREREHHLRLKRRNYGYRQSTHTHPAVVPQAVT